MVSLVASAKQLVTAGGWSSLSWDERYAKLVDHGHLQPRTSFLMRRVGGAVWEGTRLAVDTDSGGGGVVRWSFEAHQQGNWT